MNKYPVADGGAPGMRSNAKADCGMENAAQVEQMAAGKAFNNMGAKESTPSPMPASARSGAFECDESCRGYTGNPRNDR